MSKELQRKVDSVYSSLEEMHGFAPRTGVAFALAQEFPRPISVAERLKRTLSRFSTEPYWYEGAREILQELLVVRGDHVSIWTDDYLEPVATSGIGDLRRKLPFAERRRLSVDAAENKIPLLPEIIQRKRQDNISAVFVIDNNIENLKKGANILSQQNLQIPVTFLWKEETMMPLYLFDYPLQYAPIITIPSVTRETVLPLREEAVIARGGNVLWISDFNETLIDTPRVKRAVKEVLVNQLEEFVA